MKKKEKVFNNSLNDLDFIGKPLNLGVEIALNPNKNPPTGTEYIHCAGDWCVHCYEYWDNWSKSYRIACIHWNKATHKVKGIFTYSE